MPAESPDAPTPTGPDVWPPTTRWPAPLHAALPQLKQLPAHTLLGVSGGADSLALAIAAAVADQTDHCNRQVTAVVVDHQLQPGSADVAQRTAAVLERLGITTHVRAVTVDPGAGLEAAARDARYEAFRDVAELTGATIVATAHTADDQAEQVLLGLARGSGLRSLAGIRPTRTHGPLTVVRPLLHLTRADTETICRWAGVSWWEDPMNDDGARARVRHRLLPALEDPGTGLGPGVRAGLIRTADLVADDAEALEDWAHRVYAGARADIPADPATPATVALRLDDLAPLPTAIRRRVLALAVVELGSTPTAERLHAVDALMDRRPGSSAGPIELPGLHVTRERGSEYATLLMFRRLRRAPR